MIKELMQEMNNRFLDFFIKLEKLVFRLTNMENVEFLIEELRDRGTTSFDCSESIENRFFCMND